jgi:hypothetical protein
LARAVQKHNNKKSISKPFPKKIVVGGGGSDVIPPLIVLVIFFGVSWHGDFKHAYKKNRVLLGDFAGEKSTYVQRRFLGFFRFLPLLGQEQGPARPPPELLRGPVRKAHAPRTRGRCRARCYTRPSYQKFRSRISFLRLTGEEIMRMARLMRWCITGDQQTGN